jgi:hypothetical protein
VFLEIDRSIERRLVEPLGEASKTFAHEHSVCRVNDSASHFAATRAPCLSASMSC